ISLGDVKIPGAVHRDGVDQRLSRIPGTRYYGEGSIRGNPPYTITLRGEQTAVGRQRNREGPDRDIQRALAAGRRPRDQDGAGYGRRLSANSRHAAKQREQTDPAHIPGHTLRPRRRRKIYTSADLPQHYKA